MKKKIRYFLHFIFELFGYRLSNIKNVGLIDFRGTKKDPRSIGYLVFRQPALIDAPTNLGRGLPFFSLSTEGVHPYVCAVSAASKGSSTESLNRITDVLSNYYNLVQPENAVSLLGLSCEDVGLKNKPSWAAVMPWDKWSLDEWCDIHQRSVLIENSPYERELTISDGWAWVGPVSSKKLTIEAHRLNNVFTSIVENGYKRHNGDDGDILAAVLIDENGEWCWQALAGQHRATVLAGLGDESIPVRIVNIVSRNDVDFWPNVISSLYSRESALKVFDKVFSGEIPVIAAQWFKTVQKSKRI